MMTLGRPAAFALATTAWITIVCIVAAAGAIAAGSPATSTISQLAGRWSGPGVVVPSSGPSERFSCTVTYTAGAQGARVRQSFRCHGAKHQLDASTELEIAGRRVTGRWRENTHAIAGTVSGIVTANGFDINLTSRFFQARMNVAGTGCVQSVKVSPSSTDQFRQITAALKRC